MTSPQEYTDGFIKSIETTLELFHDPTELGKQSNFAEPYILAAHLPQRQTLSRDTTIAYTPEVLGRTLREVMRSVVTQMRELSDVKHHVYLANLIELHYFRQYSNKQVMIELRDPKDPDKELKQSTYFNYRRRAIALFADIFSRYIQPTVQLEQPPRVREPVGRHQHISSCRRWIKEKKTIAITGPSGIGKTTLGGYLATSPTTSENASHPVFWFTIHHDFNDRLDKLLFQLAHFLQRHGEPTLLRQLMFSEKVVNEQIALGLVYPALESLSRTAILCFDEADQLEQNEVHNPIISFLTQLNGAAPILLMGQETPLIHADEHLSLSALSLGDIHEMVEQSAIPRHRYTSQRQKIEQFYTYTHGNPRLIELCLTFMVVSDESIETMLEQLQESSSVEFVLKKIQQRLQPEEWQILQTLSVFRGRVPAMAFHDEAKYAILGRLHERQLIHFDAHGAVRLLPAYRHSILATINDAEQIARHCDAAQTRLSSGEYTAALYHLCQAKMYDQALTMWVQHKRHEMEQGQSGIALALLEQIPKAQLNQSNQEALTLIRSELRRFFGQYDQILDDIQTTEWQSADSQAEAQAIAGYCHVQRQEPSDAVQNFKKAIHIAQTNTETRLVYYYKDLANAYIHSGNIEEDEHALDEAWKAVLLAEYEVENCKGLVQEEIGNFAKATTHYQTALNLANRLQHIHGIAKSSQNLGIVYTQLDEFQSAEQYYRQAENAYQMLGHQVALAGIKQNRSIIYIEAQQYEEALSHTKESLSLFESFQNTYGIMASLINLAVIYIELSQFEIAEKYINQIMQTETPGFVCSGRRMLSEVRLGQGDLAAAYHYVNEAIDIAKEHGLSDLPYCLKTQGRVYKSQGQADAAKDAFQQALALFTRMGLKNEVAKVEAALVGL
ncbi:MAG: tetratricopeptide repeat protein [Chloroflexota bacterium]